MSGSYRNLYISRTYYQYSHLAKPPLRDDCVLAKVECRTISNNNAALCSRHPYDTKSIRVVLSHAAILPSLPLLGGGGGSSNRVFSAIIRWKPMPTPSITARRIAHPIAPFRIALGPPRVANAPPVKKPAMMAFHGSSFLRTPFTAQSKVLNIPIQNNQHTSLPKH